MHISVFFIHFVIYLILNEKTKIVIFIGEKKQLLYMFVCCLLCAVVLIKLLFTFTFVVVVDII